MCSLTEFRQSLTTPAPPAGLTHALAGLWWDAKNDWKRAHESAQQDEGLDGASVHAYLHRKEGDQGIADPGISARDLRRQGDVDCFSAHLRIAASSTVGFP